MLDAGDVVISTVNVLGFSVQSEKKKRKQGKKESSEMLAAGL